MARMGHRLTTNRMILALLLAVAMISGACSDSGDSADSRDTTASSTGNANGSDRTPADEPPGTGACDPVDETNCLTPWPSDTLTRADSSTATGIRVDLPVDGMPTNTDGTPIDPTEWNRNDGFSTASIPQVVVADLDVDASELPPQTDIGASLESDSNLVLIDLDTGERVPAWAEIDTSVTNAEEAPVRIVPARGLAEGHRHAVGLWNLVRNDGSQVEPSEAMAETLGSPDEAQAEWLGALMESRNSSDGPDVGWSFTVASAAGTTGRLVHMWTDTSEGLGLEQASDAVGAPGAPPFVVDSDEEAGATRVIEGSFTMPKYLTDDGGPGTILDNGDDPDGIPTAHGTMDMPFTCVVPASPSAPVPFVVYGHGLLGSRSEVLDIGTLGASVGVGFCAIDWIGMSTEDVPTVLAEFKDLSLFRTQVDRLTQAHLAFLLLGRLLAADDGFGTDPAFADTSGSSMIEPASITFLGASQGGILGGPSSALSPDWSRSIFAVGAMGYNLLLRRSVDFEEFLPVLAQAYPDELDQALALELTEQLWDRSENAGWAQHLTTDPLLDGADPSTVMILEAFGDHQVANVATENLARTLEVPRKVPTLAPGRSPDVEPFWGIDEIQTYPHEGSALFVWDFGTPAPPTAPTPPTEGEDPHGKLADVPQALALVIAFARENGVVLDVCGPDPCSGPG